MITHAPHLGQLLDRLRGVKARGQGWRAVCPAHDDTRPSLDVDLAHDGKVLLCCRSAGCKPADIVRSVGLALTDLFPAEEGRRRAASTRPSATPKIPVFTSAAEAVASLEHRHGRRSATWTYHSTAGDPVGLVVRWNLTDGRKDIRPLALHPDGWRVGAMPEPRPLYQLPAIAAADLVLVVEGEPAADAGRELGFTTTTSPGGASSAAKADWGPIAGKTVWVLPDHDEPGRKYAATVCAALERLTPVPAVKVIHLPGLPDAGDLVDWVASGGTREELLRIAAAPVAIAPPTRTTEATPPVTPATEAEPPKVMLSDSGNSWQFRADHLDGVRFVDDWKTWLVYDGARWQADRTRQIDALAKRTATRLFVEASAEFHAAARMLQESADEHSESRAKRAATAADAHLAHAKKLHDARVMQRMLGLARSEPGIGLTPGAFDACHWLLNTPSGTLDLRTAELRSHRREDYITRLCPTPYDPCAACPNWERFLDLVFAGDREVVGFVQRLFGYALTGDTSEQVLAVFWGGGANGKSTLLEVAMEVLGAEYSMKAPQALLMARDHEAHPTERADLFGKRLVVAVETDQGRRLSESLVKELTGGDTIRARRMRENFFQFTPTHKLILCTNYRPEIRGTDSGIWRRIRLLAFPVRFWNPATKPAAGEERPDHLRADPGMKEKLLAERAGILAWMVRGCVAWRESGLGSPPAVVDATAEYRGEEDVLGQFLSECCERLPTAKVKSASLYAAFKAWGQSAGLDHIMGVRSFGESITHAGFGKKRSGGIQYLGLKLKTDEVEQWNTAE